MSASAVMIRLALFAAVVLAWVLVRVAPAHRPAARALTAFLVIDLARPALRGHTSHLVDAALFLAAYAVQAALALRVFARVPPSIETAPGAIARRVHMALSVAVKLAPWSALVVWAIAVYTLALRWDLAASVYKAGFFAALAVQAIAVALFATRRPSELPGPAQGVSALLAISAGADMIGPWLKAHPELDWGQGGKTAVLTWVAVVAWEAWKWKAFTRR